MTKGINNWREAFWIFIMGAWIIVSGFNLAGHLQIPFPHLMVGLQAIIVGLMFHVAWINIFAPTMGEIR